VGSFPYAEGSNWHQDGSVQRNSFVPDE